LRLAESQVALKDFSGAIVSERKALALNPNLAPAYVFLAKTYLQSGRPEDAIIEARKLQKEQPSKAMGYALEGEIEAAQKKSAEAVAAFKKALAHEPQPVIATRTYALLQEMGKTAEAGAMAKKWMSDHPKDTTMLLFLTQLDLQRKDVAAARAGYERALKIDPDNMVALNNLAWILSEAKDPKGLEYAEHAHRLAPFNPTVLDTLGWALAQSGQAKRGAELLRMASSLAPAQGTIRLHFAKALLESGDRAGARQELTGLAKLDKDSAVRVEAEKILGSL
jgi:putative PEP-CTERM system TPR-repeat lipoprotein